MLVEAPPVASEAGWLSVLCLDEVEMQRYC